MVGCYLVTFSPVNKKKVSTFIVLGICINLLLLLCAWSFLFEKPQIDGPIFSPDGKFLVFSIQSRGKEALYQIQKDGSGLTPLTSGSGYDFGASYSPDGSKIVFCSAPSDKPSASASLHIMNAEDSSQRRLTFGPAHDLWPVFSPDGQRIYFLRAETFKNYSSIVSPRWHDMDIYSINADGTDLKRITHGKYYSVSRLSLTPDGKQILAQIVREKSLLWLIPVDSPENMRPLKFETTKTNNESYKKDYYDPQFSPDGKFIICSRASNTNSKGHFVYEIYKINLLTGEIIQLTHLSSYAASPRFSFDGKEIVFLFNPKWPESSSYQLWLMQLDGTNFRQIDIKFDNLK